MLFVLLFNYRNTGLLNSETSSDQIPEQQAYLNNAYVICELFVLIQHHLQITFIQFLVWHCAAYW